MLRASPPRFRLPFFQHGAGLVVTSVSHLLAGQVCLSIFTGFTPGGFASFDFY